MFGAGASSGFTFGATAAAQQQQTTAPSAGFSFGGPVPGQAAMPAAAPSASTGFQGFNFSASQPNLFIGQQTGITGGLTTGTPATVVAPTSSGFTFGTAPATVGALGVGQPTTTPVVAPGGGFTFSTPATTSLAMGQPTVNPMLNTLAATTKTTLTPAPTATAAVFPFGSAPTVTPSASLPAQTQLGTTAPTPATGGFSFGGVAPTTAGSGYAFSAPKSTLPITPAVTTAIAATSLGFVTATTTQSLTGYALGAGFKLAGSPAVTTTTAAAVAPVTAFSIGGGVAGTGGMKLSASNLLTTTLADASKPSGLSTLLSAGSSSTGAGLFGASAGSTLGTTLPAATAAPATVSSIGAIGTTTTTAITTTTLSTQMNYRQLEEAINKWSLELEEHEKIFLQQATQVNAWDRMLIENGEKITELNNDVERVKLDQQRLDHELDFIRAQQRELEELLSPLEKGVEQMPAISYQQHADLEREHTYQLSENIDAQLKRMVQDLKEIIEHVNSSSANQDNNDPILQITKILNAHMDSLQWIDQNGAMLNRRVDELSKQMDSQRKEQERSFRLTYD